MPVLIVTPVVESKANIVEAVYSNTTFAFATEPLIAGFVQAATNISFNRSEVPS
jgi:hypothetical protein